MALRRSLLAGRRRASHKYITLQFVDATNHLHFITSCSNNFSPSQNSILPRLLFCRTKTYQAPLGGLVRSWIFGGGGCHSLLQIPFLHFGKPKIRFSHRFFNLYDCTSLVGGRSSFHATFHLIVWRITTPCCTSAMFGVFHSTEPAIPRQKRFVYVSLLSCFPPCVVIVFSQLFAWRRENIGLCVCLLTCVWMTAHSYMYVFLSIGNLLCA